MSLTGYRLAFLGASLVACDGLLGGLDEGRTAVAPAQDASVSPRDAAPTVPACPGWTPGAIFRRRIHVQSTTARRRHPVRFSFDTLALERAAKIKDATSGILVATQQGERIPHVFDGLADSDAAPIYAAFDVEAGDTTAYLYYGPSLVAEPSRPDDVFVPGVIVDGTFAKPGDRAWTPLPLARGTGYEVRYEGGMGRFTMLGAGPAVGHPVGLCQFATFPPGGPYKLVYDAGSREGPRQFRVTASGLDGESIGGLVEPLPARSIMAGPIPPGGALVCFVAQRLTIATNVDFWVSNVRVAPWAESEPSVVAIDAEERCGAD